MSLREVPPSGAMAAGEGDCEGVGEEDAVRVPDPDGVAAPLAVPEADVEGVPDGVRACEGVPEADPEAAWVAVADAVRDWLGVGVALGVGLDVAVADGVGSGVVPMQDQPRAANEAGREQPVLPSAAYASAAEMFPARHASLAVTEDMRGLRVWGAGTRGRVRVGGRYGALAMREAALLQHLLTCVAASRSWRKP